MSKVMAKKNVVPKAVGRRGTMAQMVNRKGGQARMRRELAAQRKAMGAAGQARAMKNWGIRAAKPGKGKGGKTASRGGKGYSGARNG